MRETHILETKNVGLYTWRGGGRGCEKVYCLYTHENVDIFGWHLTYYTTVVHLIFNFINYYMYDHIAEYWIEYSPEKCVVLQSLCEICILINHWSDDAVTFILMWCKHVVKYFISFGINLDLEIATPTLYVHVILIQISSKFSQIYELETDQRNFLSKSKPSDVILLRPYWKYNLPHFVYQPKGFSCDLYYSFPIIMIICGTNKASWCVLETLTVCSIYF